MKQFKLSIKSTLKRIARVFRRGALPVALLACTLSVFGQPAGQLWTSAATNLSTGVTVPVRQNNTISNLVGFPMTVSGAGLSNLVTQGFTIKPGYGINVEVVYNAGTNTTTTTNMQFNANMTIDGSNYLTTTPITFKFPLNGTNVIRACTNIPYALLDGYYQFAITGVTNQDTGTTTASNVVQSVRLSRSALVDPNNPYR